jgi:nucleoside-diphosphate-sugar epimerase
MRILITGASGFIGSFIAEESLGRGYETWVGIRSTSSKKYLSDPDIHIIDLPYHSKDNMKEMLEEQKAQHGKWDVIIHNMGLTKCENKTDFDRVNFEYTRNFITALYDSDMVPAQFIYMSSLSAFGPGNPDGVDEIKLNNTPVPNTLYGESKLKTEEFIKSLPDFPYTILRPTGVYGPREKDYFVMLQTLKRHLDPAIGFKPQYITFIYVKDLVKVIFLSMEKKAIGKEYFVADGDVWTSNAYTQLAKKELGVKWAVPVKVPEFLVKGLACFLDTVCGWFGKTPTLNKDKYNILSARNWKCEIGPLKEDLGFEAEYKLDRGLRECIEWYRAEKWL